MGRKIKMALGFITGRKHFQRILRSYTYNWAETDMAGKDDISMNLYISYDLKYKNTRRNDYTSIRPEIAEKYDIIRFFGKNDEIELKERLLAGGHFDAKQIDMIFRRGYASQRNQILYNAVKDHMDYILFLDDDEYPMAVTKAGDTALWSGQQVMRSHLQNIGGADMTVGYHCGYISPIPQVEYSRELMEDDFHRFIKSISNDIVNWKSIKKVIDDGGVTYADTVILKNRTVEEVPLINSSKFISGSNLCINLKDPKRLFPFFNPPKARGEDTFLGTCLSKRKVLQVPCYTFHDGFMAYNHLLSGNLPGKLKKIEPDSAAVVKRFYNACVGWIRYKPLLLYVTDKRNYHARIKEMKDELQSTLPKICDYFGTQDFMSLPAELEKYDRTVEKQSELFDASREIWSGLMKREIIHI
ncbi:MAG: hypothetical protein VB031_06755 [Eubacteriaceae bacterium]|nr:hypothetical protein [Eubacteriaceae bacterium]